MRPFLKSVSHLYLLTIPTVIALTCLSISHSTAQDTKPASAAAAEQEAKLMATFNAATLQGRWAPLKDGQLGPEKEDAYQIVSVQKVEGDRWQVNARGQY